MTEIKMIVRSMTKSRVFCFVVLFGFSMGLACSALILSVLLRQTASDQFLRQDNQKSFRILMDNVLTGKRNVVTFGDLSGKLTDLYPEVIASSRVYTPKSCLIEYNGDETVGAKVIFSDPSFFKIFPYPVEGYTNKAITREAVFIKRSAIPNLFGDVQSVVNEIITIDGKAYHVAGIIADENRVSHLDFDLIGQIGSLSNNSDPFAYPGLTYISLPESVDENEFAAKINANVKNLVPPLPSLPGLYLQPVEEIYFGQRFEAFDNVLMYGSRDYLRILGLIAVVVLLVASINYLNLSYARSVSGFKRVAIQRILGVTSFKLFLNYFIESLAVILSSVLLALLLVALYGERVARQLGLDFIFEDLGLPVFVALFAGIILLVTVFVSLYNVWKLHRVSLNDSLRNRLTGVGSRGRTLKVLIAFQFCVSGGLLMSLIIVSEQVGFIENFNTGFEMKRLVEVNLEEVELDTRMSTLRDAFTAVAGIESVSICSGSPLGGGWNTTFRHLDEEVSVSVLFGDENFLETLGITFLQGRNFAGDSSDSNAVIVNADLVRLLNLDNPLNEELQIGEQSLKVIGIIKNFTTESLMVDAGKPCVVRRLMDDEKSMFSSSLLIRVAAAVDPLRMLNSDYFRNVLDSHVDGYVVPRSVWSQFNELHSHELSIRSWIRWFAIISTIMTCFGLVGLLSFTQELKAKEIAVRKLLGASIASLYYTMTKGTIRLALVGALGSIPIVYFLLKEWLDRFVYKMEISYWVFLFGVLVTITIALITITYHSLQVIYSNIAKRLNAE